ncbi:MAG: BON domain-containing protein [Pirellula sp.]|jgi:osmotically-inducible protein OsmY|nr:BON domain-containing protein [Pirellula sp.]
MKRLSIALFGSLALLGCDQPNATMNDRSMKDATSPVVNRDNSAVNKRDANSDTKTPFDQYENKADIAITASIRKSVVDTKMSTNAQNVKIITQDGNVTLRGPVKTQEEKDRIDEIARKVAGVKAVDSQLEVEKNP